MRVAALQFDVTDDHAANLAHLERVLRLAAAREVDLVVLPEMWPGSFPKARDGVEARVALDRASCERVRELTSELGIGVAGSALALEEGRLTNRMELFDAGASLWHYDKVHLFSPTAEQEVFEAGVDAPRVVATRFGRVAGGVCYDLRFPEVFRPAFREGVELLLVSAQWPTPRRDHWIALCIARAIENQCFVVACNRTGTAEIGRRRRLLEFPGDSLVVSPLGEVLGAASGGDEAHDGLVVADCDLDVARRFRTRVPVQKDELPELYRRWLEPRTDDS